MGQMDKETPTDAKPDIPVSRLWWGGGVFILGFISPAFIPLILNSSLPTGLKTLLSGGLAFGIPELGMLLAVAILGKTGFNYLKGKLARNLEPLAPPDRVSPLRYKAGLVLFLLPLLVGWLLPYLETHFAFLQNIPLWAYIFGDVVFLAGIYVLGGEFWDKLRGLFTQKAIIRWEE